MKTLASLKPLEMTIQRMIEPIDGTVAVYIKDLDTQEEIEIGVMERFHAASMIKVPLLYEALRQLEMGKLNLEEKYKLQQEEKVGGCGVLQLLGEGLEVTLEDLLHLMIDISDNTATNMLLDIVGKDEVNQTLRRLGIEDTLLARKLMVVAPGVYSYTTAKDMGRLFEVIEQNRIKVEEVLEEVLKEQEELKAELKAEVKKEETLKLQETEKSANRVNEKASKKAIKILLAQQMNDRLSYELNLCGACNHRVGHENTCSQCGAAISDVDTNPVPFAHKTGEIVGVVHDGGIMYLDNRRIVIVVLTKGLQNNEIGHKLLRDIGVEVYEGLGSRDLK
ncbi:serine hydrolase [Alkaliphilus hydrothermalis]|uniref:Beta-lactamase class A n=1 Tax=Alkaliphilus hydrothermalis TaxID=1482730 RepID=A0ABS2NT44_9FIRM|nr:serine hydrolase [Alkaliphilus hydrothermalis]MBM7616125.1 beta-lactamase class A [Alkaliphilus hydrothermalis]